MQSTTKERRAITEEIAYRTGFLEGARTALAWIPKYLDRGLPLVDVMDILQRWAERLDTWAQRAVVDGDGDSAPPKP